jgi:hypothetical protein
LSPRRGDVAELSQQEWEQLRGCRPPGWHLVSASWDTSGDEPILRVDAYSNRLAPIVLPGLETPTVEREDPTVIEGTGHTRADALDDACRRLSELAPD